MNYISVKDASEKWHISEQIVRRFCRQGRISGAIQTNGSWMIPADAKQPQRPERQHSENDLNPLTRKLQSQKKRKNYHGLYDYVQITFTYSSCRMASNRLTQEQVASIFKKGKVCVSFEPMKVSDVVEAQNHVVCIDYILDEVNAPLSLKFIRNLHQMLTFGTVDNRMKKVAPGQYRSVNSKCYCPFAVPATTINDELRTLIKEYEAIDEISLTDILDFHVRFERIFPFDDCNGRIGRLIAFKECLRHGVMPFIIDDKHRSRYLQGIREWERNPDMLTNVAREAQDRFESQIETQRLLAHGQNFLPANYKED